MAERKTTGYRLETYRIERFHPFGARMKKEPEIMVAPALGVALGNLLDDPSRCRVGVMGNTRIALKLASEGYSVLCPVFDRSETRSLNIKSSDMGETRQSGNIKSVFCRPTELPLEPFRLDAFFAIGVLGGQRIRNVGTTVESWSRTIRPGGVMAIAELAGEGFLGRFMLRLARRLRGRPTNLEPSDLCGLLLQAGTKDVHQVWPQGIGAWVLTHGKTAKLRDLKYQGRRMDDDK